MNSSDRERMLDLLAESTLFGLEDNDQTELGNLMTAEGGLSEADSLASVAAMLELSQLPEPLESMPESLARRIESTAHQSFAKAQDAALPVVNPSSAVASDRSTRWRIVQWTGWVVAAGLLIALMQTGKPVDSSVKLSLSEQRSRLINNGGELIQRDWQATKDSSATAASGDLVWDNRSQEGYMRIEGLAANDPTVEQYQLWIFDETQNQPIDGGVFNIPAGTDPVVIPISAKISVNKPTLFAVTVEKPGGVVVSDRERIVLAAPPKTM